MVTLQVYKCNKMNAYVLLLLSNSKEIKQEKSTEVFLKSWLVWCFSEQRFWEGQCTTGVGQAHRVLSHWEGSHTDVNEQDLQQRTGIKWTAPDTKQHQT